MEKYRRARIITIIVLMVIISGLTIGFAAFTSVLNISSQASVTPDASTFGVRFSTKQDSLDESAVVASSKSDGVEVSDGVINNTAANPSISNLNATFTIPGQYAEYTFYARNVGEYKAYLNSVNFLGEKVCSAGIDTTESLVESACNSINITVSVADNTYSQTTTIMGHALDKGQAEKVIVRLNYASDGERADGEFRVTFQMIAMVYSSIDDSTFEPPILGEIGGSLMSTISEGAVSDNGVDFSSSTGLDVENNIAYIRSGTENDTNPIYYYRGNVTKNNVIFANFCWKIVRTTETGGVKLIYNGVPAADGSCNNTGTDSQLSSTSKFNSKHTSPADVGYMYGTRYTYSEKSLSSQSGTYLYGNKVSWNGTNYTLQDTYSSTSWSSDRTTLATKYHYTCLNSTGVCSSVYYIHYFGSSSKAYYLTFTGGITLETAKDAMFTNTTNSIIKTAIDNWYAANMTSYTNKLENTIFCNDRSFNSGTLAGESVSSTDYSYFGAYGRRTSPSVECPNQNDAFTLSVANGGTSGYGNNALTYPVGLLTADEYTLAGSGTSSYSTSSYLHTGQSLWSLSPYRSNSASAVGFYLSSSDRLNFTDAINYEGVRPSVSLAPGTKIMGGDGSVSTPYIVS